jgi:hypothetical protein
MVKMDKRQKMKKVSDIVNEHIADFTAKDKTIKTNEFCFVEGSGLILVGINSNVDNEDVDTITKAETEEGVRSFDKIFNIKAPDQKRVNKSFFHYKSFERAFEFVENGYICISALSNYSNINNGDDIKEYEHFFDVVKIGTDKSFIDQQKGDLFVFCLTENNQSDFLWENYADKNKGLCLELFFEPKCPSKNLLFNMYDLRKVCYDDGKEFQFFADMQKEIIHNTFGQYLVMPGLAKFGALYKRKVDNNRKYYEEQETRLLINWKSYKEKLDKYFTIEKDNEKVFLKIPFENELFTIKIKSIIIGKNVDNLQKQKIKDLADKKNIKYYEQ